jgi:hypothetical protein
LAVLQARGWTNKIRNVKAVTPDAGKPFTKASLERLLRQPVYIGRVRYQGETYSGEQDNIVEECVWHEAQMLLAEERAQRSSTKRAPGTGRGADEAQQGGLPERVPRITRLLALALKFEQMIQQAVVSDYTELATLGRVSRSRVTQIMNLLNLAPDIQEQILFLKAGTAEERGICEQSIRRLSSVLLWNEQRAEWKALTSASSV